MERSRREKLLVLIKVLKGIGIMHAKGLAHRDLKPENILLLLPLNPKIADYGLTARIGFDENLQTYVMEAAFSGFTLRYSAPELHSRPPHNSKKSDI